MGLRERLRKNPMIGIVVAIVLFAVASVGLVRGSRLGAEAKQPGGQFFYDLATGELFVADLYAIAPIPAPSGFGNAVQAYVFSCGACNEAEQFIAYLGAFSNEARKLILKTPEIERFQIMAIGGSVAVDSGHWIAPVPKAGNAPDWITVTDPQAQRLLTIASQRCPQRLRRCLPQ